MRVMTMSVSVVAIITSLHLIAFVLAIGAEGRRSTAKVMPDEYDEKTYCVYGSDASTFYGLSAFGLLLVSQAVVNTITKCLCFGQKDTIMATTARPVFFFFAFSWVSFLGAETCLLAGSARNAYHTKYRAMLGGHLSCTTLRKGVFAAAAVLCLLSLSGSILFYWAHSKADTGGWEKHRNEGVGMTSIGVDNHRLNRGDDSEKA